MAPDGGLGFVPFAPATMAGRRSILAWDERAAARNRARPPGARLTRHPRR